MTYQGRVKNGVVILSRRVRLPEGTVVNVQPVPARLPRKRHARGQTTLAEALGRFTGCAKDLPSDLARNHDHYLYGLPKK